MAFYVVYIEEAHASDVWPDPVNTSANVSVPSPKDYQDRATAAAACVRSVPLQIPALVDDFENSTERAYRGWPDRLYLIDREGRVVYKSKPGPYGFRAIELGAALRRLLSEAVVKSRA